MTREELDREQVRRRMLGWGIAAEQVEPGAEAGRDLRLVDGPNGKALAAVESMDALSQALAIALTTPLGTDVFNTSFGFDGIRAIAEESSPMLVRERIRLSVIDVLRREPRVRRVIDVKLSDTGQFEMPEPGSRALNVRVEFQTITAESTGVELGTAFTGGNVNG